MTDPFISFFAGIMAGLFGAFGAAALLRVVSRVAPVLVFAAGIVISEVGALAAGSLFSAHFDPWLATAAVASIGISVFFAFSAVYKSVSLRMLVYVSRFGKAGVEYAQLEDTIARPAIEERMALLVEMGLAMTAGEERFTPTDAGRITHERLSRLQRLFGVSKSGLYGRF